MPTQVGGLTCTTRQVLGAGWT